MDSKPESQRWSRALKYAIIIGSGLALIWLAVVARELVGSLVIAALLAYLLKPAVDAMQRLPRVTHNLAVLVVYTLFLGILVVIPISFAPVLTERFTRRIGSLAEITQQALERAAGPVHLGELQVLPAGWVDELVQPLRSALPSRIWGSVDLVYGIGANVIWLLVIVVSVFYLLRDGPRLRDWFLRKLPPEWRSDSRMLLDEIDRIWRRYLRGQLILGLIVGVMTVLAMKAVGLREAVMLGLIAGLLDLIPSLGPMVAGLIATLVAFIAGSASLPISDGWFALLVLGLFVLIQQIENIWLRPQILGSTLRLHPGLVFVGVFGALATFGVLGALVVVPVLGSLAVLGRYAHPRILGLPPDDPAWLRAAAPAIELPVDALATPSLESEPVTPSPGPPAGSAMGDGSRSRSL